VRLNRDVGTGQEDRPSGAGRVFYRSREEAMGSVVKFPELSRAVRDENAVVDQPWSATVIILPVVRIERYYDAPSDGLSVSSGTPSGRRRRRRASRP
jgi:hypothetical protein